MEKVIKRFWGTIPFSAAALCFIIVAVIEKTTDNTLRIIPRIALTCLGLIGFGILLLWGNKKYSVSKKDENSRKFGAMVKLINILSVSALVIIALICLYRLPLSYKWEHTVTRNNIKMIARVDSFSDGNVYYYQYKNPFFYGKNLGYEYYGSGSSDPLAETLIKSPLHWAFYDPDGNLIEKSDEDDNTYNADIEENHSQKDLQQETEIKELKIDVLNNREDELVFSISIGDYINSYNSYYQAAKNVSYLTPSTEWRSNIYDKTIHSNHETIRYNFTEDPKVWPLPTISVYAPTNGEYIQEVALNFDDHSYTEEMYDLYTEMCFYTLKVFFPELKDDEVTELYTTLNSLAYSNIFPKERGYKNGAVPCDLYYKDGIGLYPYFAVGESLHLCIIPVTEKTISEFENKGVKIHEIK